MYEEFFQWLAHLEHQGMLVNFNLSNQRYVAVYHLRVTIRKPNGREVAFGWKNAEDWSAWWQTVEAVDHAA